MARNKSVPIPSSNTHFLLPAEVTGYAFDSYESWWSSIVPEKSENLIHNPSFEKLGVDGMAEGYSVSGSWNNVGVENVIVDSPDVGATMGRRCAELISSDGFGKLEYDEIEVEIGPYTFSLDLWSGRTPATFILGVFDGVNQIAAVRRTVTRPGWNRYHLSYRELSAGTRTLRLSTDNTVASSSFTVYTDAWQFENKEYPTTYLDGDMIGFSDHRPGQSYYWLGEPHASPSVRQAGTGTGGRPVSWSENADFLTVGIVGLTMPTVTHRTQDLGNGKVIHLGVDSEPRNFTIAGRIYAQDYEGLMSRHATLLALLRAQNTAHRDQSILRYQATNQRGELIGVPLDIACVYSDGLQGNITNFYQESFAVQFACTQPYPTAIYESSATLSFLKELEPNMIMYRDADGEFFNLGVGETTGGVVHRVGFLSDGRMVAFGNYTQIAGSTASYGAIWDGEAWQEIADTDSGVTDIDDGFKLGYPLTVSTVGASVFEYDTVAETWTELGAGFLGSINALQRDDNGDVWVAGNFEFAQDGVTVYNNVARWNSSAAAWEPLGDGVTDPDDLNPADLEATTVLVTNDGSVYFGGTFERGVSGAVTTLANAVIRWDINLEIFRAMGSGFNEAPNQLIQGQDGYIYAVGPFSEDGTESYDLRGFARWNGYSWEEVFPLLRPGGDYGSDGVIQDEDGIFWFYNLVIDEETDLFEIDGLGRVPFFGWRNGIFYPPYLADASVRHMAIGPGNQAIHAITGYTGAEEPIKAPALNRVYYEGSAECPIALRISGPGRLIHALNLTTEGGIYARDNFLVTANERATFRNDMQRTLVFSNQRQNLYNRLLGGATNISALHLIPGENRISLFIKEVDTGEGSDAWMVWKNRYLGITESV